MVHIDKVAGKSSIAGRARTPARAASGGTVLYAYDIDAAASKAILKKPLPKGVKLALVSKDAKAEADLGHWAGARFHRTGAVVRDHDVDKDLDVTITTSDFEPDARSRALLRGVTLARADLKAAGGAYELSEVQALLHDVSRQRVDKRVKEGSLLAVPGPSNRRRYPTVQFMSDGEVAPGLREVQQALPTKNPWAILNFLVQPDDRLAGRKPIDVLKAGDLARVVSAARSMGQQGG